MANEMIGTTESSAIVPEVWSAVFLETLVDRLPFNDCVDYRWQGEIQALGDIINISQIPEFDAASELAEGAAADADSVTVTGQQLTINNRIHKDFIVTKKSQLQSLPFMDELRSKAIYAIMKRMQQIIIDDISPSAATPDHVISYDSGSTLALADILEAKELLDTANVAEDMRSGVMGAAQWNDLFNISGFTSRDFIPAGSPLTSGSIQTPIAGFMPKMTNVVGSTSYWFHHSFMAVAIQEALNISVYDLGVEGVRAARVNVDLLMGNLQVDNTRVVSVA